MRPDLNRSCVRYLTTLPNIWFDWCVVLHNLNTNKNKVSVLVFLYRTFLPLTATHWDQLIVLKGVIPEKNSRPIPKPVNPNISKYLPVFDYFIPSHHERWISSPCSWLGSQEERHHGAWRPSWSSWQCRWWYQVCTWNILCFSIIDSSEMLKDAIKKVIKY